LLSLPEKWHGLTDIEIRYRRRYVDLVTNPDVREVFVKRSLIIRELRGSWMIRAISRWKTPILHSIAGGALAKTLSHAPQCARYASVFADRSELYLKRLIVGGLNRVYDLNRNFRNEGVSFKPTPNTRCWSFTRPTAITSI
jgi:lysyl-tRNA synthetase class 2